MIAPSAGKCPLLREIHYYERNLVKKNGRICSVKDSYSAGDRYECILIQNNNWTSWSMTRIRIKLTRLVTLKLFASQEMSL